MAQGRIRSLVSLLSLVLTVAAALVLGSAPVTAAASGGVSATATPDFTVTVSPLSQTRKRGTGAPYFVTIDSVDGFSAAVTLSLTGNIPPNGVVTITQPTGFGSLNDGEVDIQIQKHTFVTGTFAMTIQARGGGIEHDVPISLTIV
ncbi:MAG TPA: hypothetical protein VOB72_08815 [Candidatus Dormibacteraeota bacterium]|nr:hypothetical protein [Candidatus Dormibacteraeota bacterium]